MNVSGSFDGTTYSTRELSGNLQVFVKEGDIKIDFIVPSAIGLGATAYLHVAPWVRAGMDAWTADRIAYVFSLVERALAA